MSDPYASSGRASVPGQARPAGQPMSGRAAVPVAGPAPGQGPVYGQPAGGRRPGGRGPAGRGPGGGPPAALIGKRRKPRWRKVLLGITLTLVLLLGVGAGAGYAYARNLESNLKRVEAFSPITGERPSKPAARSLNILVFGHDSRDPEADVERADTIMLLHVPGGRDQAYAISIPRDLWVYIPASPDGTAGNQEAKINAATAFGGVPLGVMAVENYTGVRVDHVMVMDFSGFVEVTDAVGGVDMHINETITSIHGERRVFEEGDQHLTGDEALDYIRQRYQFAQGDFTRMQNQQQFLRSLLDQAASRETLRSPSKLNAFLQAATSTLTVDEEFSLISVGWKLRKLRGDNLTFLTSPHAGTGNIGGQSVVLSDDEAAAELYRAIREDRMAQWAAANPDALPG